MHSSDVQTEIVWGIAKQSIPEEYHDKTKGVFGQIMNHITAGEIEFVKQFLKQSNREKTCSKTLGAPHRESMMTHSRENEVRRKRKFPRRLGMSDIAKMDEIIKEYGKDGIRFLILFKLLKTRVISDLSRKYPQIPLNEDVVDKICAKKARYLLELGKERPTEAEIKELLLRLRKQKPI